MAPWVTKDDVRRRPRRIRGDLFLSPGEREGEGNALVSGDTSTPSPIPLPLGKGAWWPSRGLVACADRAPTIIDGSSAQAFERTTEAARREIPDADRLAFDRALHTVGGRRHSERDPEALARVTFNGMTARDVVADARAREH